MSMQATARSSNQPLGGTSGDWRRRLLRHYLPLALASAVVILLWMSLPLFRLPASTAAAQHGPPQAAGQQMQMPPQEAHAAGHLPPQAAQVGGAASSTDPRRGQSAGLEVTQNRGFLGRLSTATGYVALGLLAFTLLIGPANLLLRRRNPVSSYLRRDVGMWTAIVSVVHVALGLQTHGPPTAPFGERILRYFFAPDGSPLTDSFGLGNWTGLAATVIVVGLLAISSDFALRKLKAGPWKWLQRLNYALFALVVAHAIYYAAFGGTLLRVTSPSTLLLGPTIIAVVIGQTVGVWLWRRRHVRTTARLA